MLLNNPHLRIINSTPPSYGRVDDEQKSAKIVVLSAIFGLGRPKSVYCAGISG